MIPAIFGISGPELTDRERAFLAERQPLGVILFRRNIDTPAQVLALNESIRAALDRSGPCVWVDQEGGRVQRLTAPHWEKLPTARAIGERFAECPETGLRAAFLLGRIIADQALGVDFDVVCAPVLDLGLPETHEAIGDRAFDGDPETVAALGRAMADGLASGGVLPVSKHWPGHGRSRVDSHDALPGVLEDRETLEETDLKAFALAADCAPIAMTGHLVFEAFDPVHPATLSDAVIRDVIRGHCGFRGFLVSDDLDMKALDGDRGDLARRAIAAGCDAVLQCSGDFETMAKVADALAPIGPESGARWAAAGRGRKVPDNPDRPALIEELREALGGIGSNG
jgi:beta-N-acetylhexosaminidase